MKQIIREIFIYRVKSKIFINYHGKNMRICSFIFVFFLVLNISTNSQNKNYLLRATYHNWEYSYDCITKWGVTFENLTGKKVSSVTFWLIIQDSESSNFIYRKKHTVSISLDADEIAPSPLFNLSQKICVNDTYNFKDDYNFWVEVISYK